MVLTSSKQLASLISPRITSKVCDFPVFEGYSYKNKNYFKLFEQSTLKLRARAKLRIEENNKQTSNALSGGIIAGAMISPQ